VLRAADKSRDDDAPAAAGIGSRVRSLARSGTHNRFDSLLRDEDGRRDRRERINEKERDGVGGENGALASAAALTIARARRSES